MRWDGGNMIRFAGQKDVSLWQQRQVVDVGRADRKVDEESNAVVQAGQCGSKLEQQERLQVWGGGGLYFRQGFEEDKGAGSRSLAMLEVVLSQGCSKEEQRDLQMRGADQETRVGAHWIS